MSSEDSGEYLSCRSSFSNESFASGGPFEDDASASATDKPQRNGPLCECLSAREVIALAALDPTALEWYPTWNYTSPLSPLHPTTSTTSTMTMAASSSSSWTSPEATKKARLERLQANAGYIHVIGSPFFPQNLAQYLEHETKWTEQKAVEMSARLKRRKEDKRDVAINFQHSTDPAILFNKGEVKGGGVQQVARTIRTLAEHMEIWTLGYEEKDERRVIRKTGEFDMRASWPEQNELKAEGEHRQIVFGQRRLPLPRKDEYSTECFKLKLGVGTPVWDIVRTPGDEIAWYEKVAIQLMGLDRLESTMKEFKSEDKTWTVEGVMTPPRQNTFNPSFNAHQRLPSRRGGQRPSSAVDLSDRQAFLIANATTENGRAPPALNVFANNFTPGAETRTQQMTAGNTWSNFAQHNKNLTAQQIAQYARLGGLGDGSQNYIPQSQMRGWGNSAGGLATNKANSPGFATSANRAVSGHRRRRGSFGRLFNQGRGGSAGKMDRPNRKTSGESASSSGTRKTSGENRDKETAREPDLFDNFESEDSFFIEKGMGDLLRELE